MDWPSVAQYVELCLAFVLAARLLSLGLHRVYRYFSIFLLADILGTLLWALHQRLAGTKFEFDYRIMWLADSVVIWVFTLLTVYALLDAILIQLPGILTLSRRVLNVSLIAAVVVSFLTAWPEYTAAARSQPLRDRLAHVVAAGIVLDRVIATVALLTLLCILLFLLWFPVDMSRNLVTFFAGFVVQFALRAFLLLALSLRSNGAAEFFRFVNLTSAVVMSVIFAGWSVFITKAGEKVPAKLRVAPWRRREEDLLVAQLEAMNASLLKAVRR